ncbi:MAG: hypothetical protein ACKOEM_13500, partial [Planctomycetia bacterium]
MIFRSWKLLACTLIVAALVGSGPAVAAGERPTPGLHPVLASWREIPVLEDGRIMPLDTFARRHVEAISNTQTPKLATGPDGALVRWQADELLLDWLARPQAWEDIPFLIAEHEEVRKLLELPVFDSSGGEKRRLKYAAPSDVADSEPLRKRLVEIDERRRAARAEGGQFRLEGVDAKIDQLWRAYVDWRQLTFRASSDAIGRSRFVQLFEQAAGAWRQVRSQLAAAEGDAAGQDVDAAFLDLAESLGQSTRFETAIAQPKVEAVQGAVTALAARAESLPAAARRGVRRLADRVDVLAESLYDNGGGLLVMPAVRAEPLEAERNADDDMPPWVALSTLLDAPPAALSGLPADGVESIRAGFATLAEAVVLPAGGPERDAAAAKGARALATELRLLGEAVEPLRRQLPIEQVDADLLRYTAYPPAGSTRREVAYNESDPFRMSWVLSLLALFSFAVAFGRARGPMFWLGVGLLVSELAWTTAAFASRVAITGWAPVTNMYETVIYVPFFLALLGLCFLMAPACARGVGQAWRMTALPTPLGSFIPGERGTGFAPWIALGPRIALSAL